MKLDAFKPILLNIIINIGLLLHLCSGRDGIHMAAVWFCPYGCHMHTTQKASDFAICLLYGCHTDGIWQIHMPPVWHTYCRHID